MLSEQEQKQKCLEAAAEVARSRLKGEEAERVAEFVTAFFERMTADDLLERTPESLFGQALSIWRFGEIRAPGECKLRVFNPTLDESGWQSQHTVIEIINRDMPFLVDSVTAELTLEGREILMVAHPVFRVERDENGKRIALHRSNKDGEGSLESFIALSVDTQSDADVLKNMRDRLEAVLRDVRAAVTDWKPMLAKLDDAIAHLKKHPGPAEPEEVDESIAFLEWLADDNFTFLGHRAYGFERRNGDLALTDPKGSDGLGLMRESDFYVLREHDGFGPISEGVRAFLSQPDPLIIMKANIRSPVHRPVHLDYVGVKRFDKDGNLVGESRFVGLFTSRAYSLQPKSIPLLRRKVDQVVDRSGFTRVSHDGKALINVLESFPRDELFQVSIDQLYEATEAILRLEERPRTRAFIRHDRYGQFVSALVYVPREAFNTDLRVKIQNIFAEAYEGQIAAQYAQLGDSPLARLHLIVRTTDEAMAHADPDEIEDKVIVASRTWSDRFKDRLTEKFGDETGNKHWARYAEHFTVAYREEFEPGFAISDIVYLEQLTDANSMAFHAYRRAEDAPDTIRVKIYHGSRLVPLSECLPKLENLGLHVVEEQTFEITPTGFDRTCWIHDFCAVCHGGGTLELSDVREPVEETLAAIWEERAEDDNLNRLVINGGLTWRQVAVLRAYLKYLRQTGVMFSQSYLRLSLNNNPQIACNLSRLFATRFDPENCNPDEAEAAATEIKEQLDDVQSLDEDRILRRFLNLVTCTLRTNYYRDDSDGRDRRHLSFKLDSQRVTDLPAPRPHVEIFVYSPRVEGVHLRGGKVARGGLRWSDRPEDFRTEVLGLVKAQMVKNAVIVPLGAKGGFVPKQLPAGGTREQIQEEAIACYKTFISGLLDLTDNIVEGEVVPPPRVIRFDDDDPYLVVAADKGTATFSDIANEMARSYGFWLDDAFASGGSYGYDHKKMGITARGAWVCVQRHFRELGVDIQNETIRVIGIGDMSGDVFGNGMLLSEAIQLVAAFNHMHIFIDPDPDPKKSFTERKRLFDLSRSTWEDYDSSLISAGGGIFNRAAKSIDLTPEMQTLVGTKETSMSPAAFIHELLGAKADLLWIGGIGTYVKAAGETNGDVGDRANDTLRVNGRDLNVKVVGEGGNLGMTQLGRIEFARKGGRLDTDAVDHPAGVDCSDHEVNIKILLDSVVAAGDMTEKQRNKMLQDMTEDVAQHVLETNYRQAEMLSTTEARTEELLEPQARFMRHLEQEGTLDRSIEFLPNDEEINARLSAGEGLTRPELCVLLAYAKNSLFARLMRSPLPDNAWLDRDLRTYFPPLLREKYSEAMKGHRLAREIKATVLANEIINRAGVTYVTRAAEETGAPVDEIAAAYVVARELLDLPAVWDQIDALDNQIPANIQTRMSLETKELLHRTATWLLRHLQLPLQIEEAIDRFKPDTEILFKNPSALFSDALASRVQERLADLEALGVPTALARTVVCFRPLASAGDIVLLDEHVDIPLEDIARAYFRIGEEVSFTFLRRAAEETRTGDHWDRLAVGSIIDDLYDQQRELASHALAQGGLDNWLDSRMQSVNRARTLIDELQSSGDITVGKLGYVARQLRGLFSAI